MSVNNTPYKEPEHITINDVNFHMEDYEVIRGLKR